MLVLQVRVDDDAWVVLVVARCIALLIERTLQLLSREVKPLCHSLVSFCRGSRGYGKTSTHHVQVAVARHGCCCIWGFVQ